MIKKCGKCDNLISFAGVFELAGIETGSPAEEVVDLPGLDVVWKTRNEEGMDLL